MKTNNFLYNNEVVVTIKKDEKCATQEDK